MAITTASPSQRNAAVPRATRVLEREATSGVLRPRRFGSSSLFDDQTAARKNQGLTLTAGRFGHVLCGNSQTE